MQLIVRRRPVPQGRAWVFLKYCEWWLPMQIMWADQTLFQLPQSMATTAHWTRCRKQQVWGSDELPYQKGGGEGYKEQILVQNYLNLVWVKIINQLLISTVKVLKIISKSSGVERPVASVWVFSCSLFNTCTTNTEFIHSYSIPSPLSIFSGNQAV